MIVVFSLLEPDAFATVNNARNIATNAAILLVIAVGMTFVIITAGIDLSVGSVLVFAGVVSAKAMNGMGGDSSACCSSASSWRSAAASAGACSTAS